ncbi:MAG TPA: 4'-phosphopantetheinyl transferase superfamily protein [Anaeromyxobacteraceae bacterium]|nr:4'-phosphopantetheinyl transferase superfamily protein [Anaeromyxobacteraceae bacterium]
MQLGDGVRDGGEASLTVTERARFAEHRVHQRRADWLIGRLTAKSVVARALGFPADGPLGAIEIENDPSGAPYARVAPEKSALGRFAPGERLPISLSISHTEGYALCAAAPLDPAGDGSHAAVGIDLGRVEPRSPEFLATFLTEDERDFVRAAPRPEQPLRSNLVWCAKEAVLKALGLGLTVDTFDLTCLPEAGSVRPIPWQIIPRGEEWHPFVATCIPSLLAGGGMVRGAWRSFPGLVGALACWERSVRAFPPGRDART